MKYLNAADVLPEEFLMEIQKHINGKLVYIPNVEIRKKWGEKSGSKNYFDKRNRKIKSEYQCGKTMDQLSAEFGLAFETVRKIIYVK